MSRAIHRDGQVFRLTTTEHRLLSWITTQPDTLLSTGELLTEVWGMRASTRTRAVAHAVQRLRKKLEQDPSAPRHLVTEHGGGYRWMPAAPDVRPTAQDEEPPAPNLPTFRDRFFGRSAALDALRAMLDQGMRLLSIVAMGGVGKTRLAIRFATDEAVRFPGGVWMCDCTAAQDAAGVATALGRALRLPLGKAPVPQLGAALRAHGKVLVVFDNMEAVTDHAAETLGAWLAAAPEAVFVATSRIRLGLSGEALLPLKPLSAEDAAALFMDRARMFRPSLTQTPDSDILVCEIVDQLDRLAHAIELAAAQTRYMGLESLHRRLPQRLDLRSAWRDRAPRHQTLRAMIDWSWQLLSPEEQDILAQASVFHGGFTLEAAEAVLQPGAATAPPALDVLFSLLDQSLVQVELSGHGAERYHLLESVRVFAAEQLAAAHPVRARHAKHYTAESLRRCEHARHHIEWSRWQALLDELGNLDVAMEHHAAVQDCSGAYECAMNANEVLKLFGPLDAAVAWLERGLALPQPLLPRAKLRGVWAVTARLMGQEEAAFSTLSEIKPIFAAAGDTRSYVITVLELARMHEDRGNAAESLRLLAESQALAEATQDPRNGAITQTQLGRHHRMRGDLAVAEAHYQAALRLYQRLGDPSQQGDLLGRLGGLYADRGAMDVAQTALQQAVALHRRAGNRRQEGIALGNLGLTHAKAGQPKQARACYQQALAILQALGSQRNAFLVLGNLGALCSEQGLWSEAEPYLTEAITLGEVLLPAASVYYRAHLSMVCVQLGRPQQARTLLAAAVPRRSSMPRIQQIEFCCWQAQTLHLLDEPDEADAALAEAEQLAAGIGFASTIVVSTRALVQGDPKRMLPRDSNEAS